ncbi:MAG: HEPN domain-containing protein [Bellilinea sp.]
MKQDQVKQLIQYRLEQSRETLREGEILAREGLWHGVINRAYYAMFYATLALTVFRSESISKHSGVISFFDKEFIRTGIFPKEYSRMLHLAYDRRQSNDYGEFSYVDKGEAETALSEAKSFVETVDAYLKPSRLNLDEPTE